MNTQKIQRFSKLTSSRIIIRLVMQSPLMIVAKSYITESSLTNDETSQNNAVNILEKLINNEIEEKEAINSLNSLIGSEDPAIKIIQILQIAQQPHTQANQNDNNNDGNNFNDIEIIEHMLDNNCTEMITSQKNESTSTKNDRKNSKRREWSNFEDQRLLAGMHIFGENNWTLVSKFVGNDRSRAQCSQRWSRGLDPRILKGPWTIEEEKDLIRCVKLYGDHAWKTIAANMNNRSDAQCRYHYKLIQKRSEISKAIQVKKRRKSFVPQKKSQKLILQNVDLLKNEKKSITNNSALINYTTKCIEHEINGAINSFKTDSDQNITVSNNNIRYSNELQQQKSEENEENNNNITTNENELIEIFFPFSWSVA